MSKFTPGPWIVKSEIIVTYDTNTGEKLPDSSRHFIYPDAPEGFHLALANSYSVPEAAANARLIAAAPDLLEALSMTRGQWIHSVNAEICLAAIAKATGGEG